jgi:hypothetical protein
LDSVVVIVGVGCNCCPLEKGRTYLTGGRVKRRRGRRRRRGDQAKNLKYTQGENQTWGQTDEEWERVSHKKALE